jgi:hypothetical protein
MNIQEINLLLYNARVRFNHKVNKDSVYRSLLADTELSNYFRRYYPFIEIPGIRKYLSRSRFYNKEFNEKISNEIANTKQLFEANLKHASLTFGTEFKVKLSNRDLYVLDNLLAIKLFSKFNSFNFPSSIELVKKLNLRASSGLKEPWYKKAHFINEINRIAESIINKEFELYDFLNNEQMFSAAFKRFQITSKAMKARLVFCLTYSLNVAEAMFDIPLKQMFEHPDCPMVHGRTQLELSSLITRHRKFYCLSFDVKEFDLRVPGEIIVLSFNYMALSLGLSTDSYLIRLFNSIRDLNLCMPVFHPVLELVDRKRGISSGSGLTSSLGSFCMYIMHTLTLMDYCKMYKINIFRVFSAIYVSSDDSLIFTSFRIDNVVYMSLFKRKFDMELELEGSSDPNVDSAFFLGSEWLNGQPFRNTDRMLARILFGSPNMPRMDNTHVLFCSRAYEILGNVANFNEIWKTFQVPMSDRLFRFTELADYKLKSEINSLNLLDRRGFWTQRDFDLELDRVWTTR